VFVGGVLGGHNCRHSGVAQTRRVAARTVEMLHKHVAKAAPVGGILERQRERVALADHLVKQAHAAARQQMIPNRGGSGRLPHQRDAPRVAAKRGGVVGDPPQGQALVQDAQVARNVVLHQPAQRSQAIVDRHHDKGRGPHPVARVVQQRRGRALPEVAPRQKHHHGQRRARRVVGHKDVELQTVFALRRVRRTERRDTQLTRTAGQTRGGSWHVWGQPGPKVLASRGSLHGCTGTGCCQRSDPTGGSANGMFRNEVATSSLTPTTGPDVVTTVTGALQTAVSRRHTTKTIFGLSCTGSRGVSASSSLPVRVRAIAARVSAAGFRQENSGFGEHPRGSAGSQQHAFRAH
jgi:hypothetical protein